MMDGVMSGTRQKMMSKVVNQMSQGESGDILTGLIAAKEIDLLHKIDRLHDEVGIDEIENIPTKEQRKESLKALVEALIANDIPQFWFDEVGRRRLENADDAQDYLNIDGEDWKAHIDKIVRSYRRQGDERPRSAVVCDYVNRKYGVEVGWFVSFVVNWTPEQKQNVASTFLLGNFNGVGAGIDRVTEELAEGDDAPDE